MVQLLQNPRFNWLSLNLYSYLLQSNCIIILITPCRADCQFSGYIITAYPGKPGSSLMTAASECNPHGSVPTVLVDFIEVFYLETWRIGLTEYYRKVFKNK